MRVNRFTSRRNIAWSGNYLGHASRIRIINRSARQVPGWLAAVERLARTGHGGDGYRPRKLGRTVLSAGGNALRPTRGRAGRRLGVIAKDRDQRRR